MIEGRPAAESIVGYIALSYTPEGLMTAAIASVIQLSLLGRDFLSRRLVDRYSAAMLAELPIRIVGVWFVVLLLLVPVYAGTILFDSGRGAVGLGFSFYFLERNSPLIGPSFDYGTNRIQGCLLNCSSRTRAKQSRLLHGSWPSQARTALTGPLAVRRFPIRFAPRE